MRDADEDGVAGRDVEARRLFAFEYRPEVLADGVGLWVPKAKASAHDSIICLWRANACFIRRCFLALLNLCLLGKCLEGQMRVYFFCIVLGATYSTTLLADTPCDFKGLAVGDSATPQQIMAHYGITKFRVEKEQEQLSDAEFNEKMDRAKKTSIVNAQEEDDWKKGAICDKDFCRIPYGVTIGNDPYPTNVQLFLGFNSKGVITEIDVSFDHDAWEEVLAILNNKYGDNWRVETSDLGTYDFVQRSSLVVSQISLTHKNPGRNVKTGDACSIFANAYDAWYVHSIEPRYRANVIIRLISRNF